MKLETFDFNSAAVRVMVRDDAPWFVAADVCRVLDLQNPTDAVKGLDEDEKITLANSEGNPRAGIPHQLSLISESGLYALVFKSRKPEAKAFRKWVTSEVLPAIRQTGKYESPAPLGTPESVSLFTFLREVGQAWTLERQMDFGQTARRYAKAMGVVFEIITEPGIGRVFAFPRPVLEQVLQGCQRSRHLPEPDAQDFQKLLEALAGQGAGGHAPEAVRSLAKTMGLFPRIFTQSTSVESERAAFGRLCERYNGQVFPGGLCLRVRGHDVKRRYEVTQTAPELALTA